MKPMAGNFARDVQMTKIEIIHATCLALDDIGVLLLGPSGSGKSDLALRMIDRAGHGLGTGMVETRLVADDRVALRRSGDNKLVGTAPEPLAGRLEVRGLGIVTVPYRDEIEISLAVELVQSDQVERLPDVSEKHVNIAGCMLPVFKLAPFEPSAPAKLRAAVIAHTSASGRRGKSANRLSKQS
jgi:serine kinase of HPr protein (carbohydrate metabolism regulator)